VQSELIHVYVEKLMIINIICIKIEKLFVNIIHTSIPKKI